MKEISEREKLIIKLAPDFPMAEIVKQIGTSIQNISKLCQKLGVKPISPREYKIRIILANYKTMGAVELAEKLEMKPRSMVNEYGPLLNIKFILSADEKKLLYGKPAKQKKAPAERIRPAPQPRQPKKSARDILSGFRHSDAHHYHYPEMDPVEMERAKLRRDLKNL